MFGRLVTPISRAGRNGILVKIEESAVTINGLVYLDIDALRVKQSNRRMLPDRDGESRFDVTRRVAARVRQQSIADIGKDSVTVAGSRLPVGVFAEFMVVDGKPVLVAYFENTFRVRFDELTILCGYATPAIEPTINSPTRDLVRARDVYDSMVETLEPGSLVLLGHGYQSVYRDHSMYPELREAMARIPGLARALPFPDVDGETMYEPLRIGRFSFNSSEVRDFVRSSGREK